MDLAFVNRSYAILASDRWGLLYSGSFHDEHSARLIELAEEAGDPIEKRDTTLTKKLAFVMVEAYQNVIRHRIPLPVDLTTGVARSLFLVRSTGGSSEVAAMNPIREEEIQRLREQLERIARHGDLKQLKELFLRGLQGDSTSQRGGAGLGLIEMARRSAGGIDHDVRTLQQGIAMLTLRMRVGSTSIGPTAMETLSGLQADIGRSGLELLYKGGNHPGVRTTLMRMIATDVAARDADGDPVVKTYLAAMEYVDHTDPGLSPPMIAFGREDGQHALVIGMVMAKETAEERMAQMNELNEMDPRLSQRLYRDALLGRGERADLPAGSIELVRRSRTPIEMAIFPQKDLFLLLLKAQV